MTIPFCILVAGSLWMSAGPEKQAYANINVYPLITSANQGTELLLQYGGYSSTTVTLPTALIGSTVPEILTHCEKEAAHKE